MILLIFGILFIAIGSLLALFSIFSVVILIYLAIKKEDAGTDPGLAIIFVSILALIFTMGGIAMIKF